MELTPGVELVWWLASREAMRAKTCLVEPDHFFCALLTFAEMTDNELQTVAKLDLAQEKLVEQRDKLRWHLRLRKLDARTTELRHAVRRAAPQGEDEAAGATLHRSESAQRIFEAASDLALQSQEKLAPQHLLYALLEAPTPAMSQALAGVEPPGEPETPPLPDTLVAHTPAGRALQATPALDRYTRSVSPAPGPGAGVADDLRAALAAETHSPRLLICSPGTPLWTLMAAAVQGVPAPGRVAAVVTAGLPRETWFSLLAEARLTATLLFIDLTQQEPANLEQAVAALAALVEDTDGVLVAVQADQYHRYIQLKPEWANAFNPLWL